MLVLYCIHQSQLLQAFLAVNCPQVKSGLCWAGGIWRCADMKCFCTVKQHFFLVGYWWWNPPVIDKLQQKCLAWGKLPFIPCRFKSLNLELVEYSMYRCFKKHISGACPALDVLTPGRERSPLSLTSHLLPGQKRQHPSCAKCVKHHLSVVLLKAQQAWINFHCMCSCNKSRVYEYVGFFEKNLLSYSPNNLPVLYIMSQMSVPGIDTRLFEMEFYFLVICFSDLYFPSVSPTPYKWLWWKVSAAQPVGFVFSLRTVQVAQVLGSFLRMGCRQEA